MLSVFLLQKPYLRVCFYTPSAVLNPPSVLPFILRWKAFSSGLLQQQSNAPAKAIEAAAAPPYAAIAYVDPPKNAATKANPLNGIVTANSAATATVAVANATRNNRAANAFPQVREVKQQQSRPRMLPFGDEGGSEGYSSESSADWALGPDAAAAAAAIFLPVASPASNVPPPTDAALPAVGDGGAPAEPAASVLGCTTNGAVATNGAAIIFSPLHG